MTDWNWDDKEKHWIYTPLGTFESTRVLPIGYVKQRAPGKYMAFYGSECVSLDAGDMNEAMRAVETRAAKEDLEGVPDTNIKPIPPSETPKGGLA